MPNDFIKMRNDMMDAEAYLALNPKPISQSSIDRECARRDSADHYHRQKVLEMLDGHDYD